MSLLHLDSSILGDVSASRALGRAVVDAWRAADPDLDVIHRDLIRDPIGHFTADDFAALTTPAEQRTEAQTRAASLNEAVLEEFLAADALVIAAPMYNFSLPSQLKAWIDRICVAGRTFRYTEHGPEGLAVGKKVVIVSTTGGIHAGQPTGNGHEGYLLQVLAFLGITDIEIVRAEGLAYGEAPRATALGQAQQAIGQLFIAA